MNYTKMDQISAIAMATNQPKKLIKDVYDAFVYAVTTAVANGHRVSVDGLGVLQAVERKARKSYNPRSQKIMLLPTIQRPRFTPAKSFREIVDPSVIKEAKKRNGLNPKPKPRKRPEPLKPKNDNHGKTK
jgi:nucleoid DNA-binding protein